MIIQTTIFDKKGSHPGEFYQNVIALFSYILEPSVVIAVSINGSLLSGSTLKDSLIFSRLESAICDACS